MQFDDDRKKPLNEEEVKIFDEYFNLENGISQERKDYNKQLCERYPFLIPSNRFSGIKITEAQNGGYWPGDPEAIPEYDYEYTELDSMPDGWRKAFGEQMCEELKNELLKFNYLDKYRITQIKEKFGTLRWYDEGYPIGDVGGKEFVLAKDEFSYPQYDAEHELWKYEGKDENGKYLYAHYTVFDKCHVGDIIDKYDKVSAYTCINCGKPATKIATFWISPYCDDCMDDREEFIPIEKYYS